MAARLFDDVAADLAASARTEFVEQLEMLRSVVAHDVAVAAATVVARSQDEFEALVCKVEVLLLSAE